jgi:hypothetical protein
MKWIKTKNKKPPLDTHVLVGEWTRYSNTKWKVWIDIGMRYHSKCYNKICWNYHGDSDGDGGHEEDISGYPEYWMPLPELPPITKKMKDDEKKGIAEYKNERIDTLKKEIKSIEREED